MSKDKSWFMRPEKLEEEWGCDSPIIKYSDGKEIFVPNWAVAEMLMDEIILISDNYYSKDSLSSTILSVKSSDVFAWGVSDADELPFGEIKNLYKMHIKDRHWGHVYWLCLRRNEKPQRPIIKQLKAVGLWDDVMENLPNNIYDTEISKAFREKKEKN